MRLVIELDKEMYEDANILIVKDLPELKKIIAEGKPLPKGHGKLIDADAFQKSYCDSNCGNRKCVDAMDKCIFIGDLQDAPTIIEADKEGK